MEFKIGNKKVGDDHPVFFIAEAGVNHNGSIDMGKQLIDIAVEAEADAVKFQTWITELLLTKEAELADYQKENGDKFKSQFDMAKKLELSFSEFYIVLL